MTPPLSLPLLPTLTGTSPVFHAQFDDFLPDDEYRKLYDSFPGQAWFSTIIEGDKKVMSTRVAPDAIAELCREHPEWQQLFDQFQSAPFLDSLYELLKDPIRRIRGRIGGRRWTFEKRSLLRPGTWFKREAVVAIQFSRLDAGSFVPPHTDAPEKLATVLLYFTPPGWQPEWGGDTLLYKPKHPELNNNWHNRRVPFEDSIPAFSNEYVGNRLFVFTKCAESLHGVPPVECPPDQARISLNVNVLLRPPSRFKRLRKKLARRAREREQSRHPY